MKRFLATCAFLIPNALLADTFQSTFPITAATIYPQGAMLDRSVSIDVPAGSHEIQLLLNTHHHRGADPKLSVTGAAVENISLSVMGLDDPETFYTTDQAAAVTAVDDQKAVLRALNANMAEAQKKRAAIQTQAKFLNAITPSTETPQSFEELQKITEYLPKALSDNAEKLRQSDIDIAALKRKIKDAKDELRLREHRVTWMNLPKRETRIARVLVNADAAGTVQITANEFTNDAGWQMTYDIALDEDSGEITLDRTAQIAQTSPENWSNVAVVLSSANPNQRLTPNVPHRDVVELVKPANRAFSKSVSYDAEPGAMATPAIVAEVMEMSAAPSINGTFDGVAVEYALPQPVSLRAVFDQQQQFDLEPLTITADVDRYASPRRDQYAFVRATFTNDTGEPILTGQAKFLRDGNLVGDRRIRFIPAGGEGELFFGPDKSLPLEMRFTSEMSGDVGFISRSNTRQEVMEFDIQNIGPKDQKVTVAYALPISVEEDVDVRITSNPRPDRENVDGIQGRAEWDLDLKSGQKQPFGLDVTVTWPDGAEILWRP